MERDKRNIEFEVPKEESGRQFSLRSLINGNILTQKVVMKQAPFIILLVFIGLLSIANRNHAEKLVIQSLELQTEVRELRSESITTSSELMKMSRQSMVEKEIREKGIDLEENKEPLKKLEIHKNEK